MAKKTNSSTKFNPNSSRNAVFSADVGNEKVYPKFVEGIKFENFRHIESLSVHFKKPVSVIAGSNKSGKTTVLLAIACSHFEFKKRNFSNGHVERHTWSDVIKTTPFDVQTVDWTYWLTTKTGAKRDTRRGQRKAQTNKWNGVGKKESQVKDVQAIYVDLDRVLPARYFSSTLLRKSVQATATSLSSKNQQLIDDCLSYIFEDEYSVKRVATHGSEEVLGFTGSNSKYSSYNCASGEDVVSRILIDCIEAPNNSLILIDEIEIGLHPGVQRRLMDVIFHISDEGQKQFIITTHSSTVLSSVPDTARIFIDRKDGRHETVCPVSLNAALSKMDSVNYPLVDLFCEDDVAEMIIKKALGIMNKKNVPGLTSKLVNVVISGSANDTYDNFKVRKRTYDSVKIRSGHCCVLDGDMEAKKDSDGKPLFPADEFLHFLPGTVPPEKMLCDLYEKSNPNTKLRYHIQKSNVHCLFDKMMEHADFTSKVEAFEAAWSCFLNSPTHMAELDGLIEFIEKVCRAYSPDL